MGAELRRLADEKYVQLTTFRKSGDAVPTPVWAAEDDGELVLFSGRTAGKVKRIRREPHVEVVACDLRGRATHGATVTGVARILDDDASERVRRVIARKYGLSGTITMFFSRLRGGSQRTVGIAVALDE
ncbi:PPOX class F420-dependent oxidoreductase [Prauserella cavernicola]|uniref:PPOX class F420-dependent oxidoreductase n=1 Tax=Prauserella cavernicola TaxID=2800127 RepID=A0A934QQ28_9PSEU|nr:PPOX class F420-dependent oxidoreductase [Prauserella cavernicola]MBK1786112.1 PPOX class F420-dependent oxidoreductase [Prauserella cavernicola]